MHARSQVIRFGSTYTQLPQIGALLNFIQEHRIGPLTSPAAHQSAKIERSGAINSMSEFEKRHELRMRIYEIEAEACRLRAELRSRKPPRD